MKITEQQLLMLYQVLNDSLLLDGLLLSKNSFGVFRYSKEERMSLANDIINQQSETIFKICEETNLDKFICVFCGSSEGTPLALTCNPPIHCCTICSGREDLKKSWRILGEQNA